MWVWPSTKPGATTWPSASSVSRPRSRMRPIETMRPCRTPTSARKPGRPEPSITVPFLITRSNGMWILPGVVPVSYSTQARSANSEGMETQAPARRRAGAITSAGARAARVSLPSVVPQLAPVVAALRAVLVQVAPVLVRLAAVGTQVTAIVAERLLVLPHGRRVARLLVRTELLTVGADLAPVLAALLAVAAQLAAVLADLTLIAAQLSTVLPHVAGRRVLSADDRAHDGDTDGGGDEGTERDDLHGCCPPRPL